VVANNDTWPKGPEGPRIQSSNHDESSRIGGLRQKRCIILLKGLCFGGKFFLMEENEKRKERRGEKNYGEKSG
jgi:hypothetical protein